MSGIPSDQRKAKRAMSKQEAVGGKPDSREVPAASWMASGCASWPSLRFLRRKVFSDAGNMLAALEANYTSLVHDLNPHYMQVINACGTSEY